MKMTPGMRMKMGMKNKYKIKKSDGKFILYKGRFFWKKEVGIYKSSIEAYTKIVKLETGTEITLPEK